MTARKGKKLSRKLPVGGIEDYEEAYRQALAVVAELNTQIDQLNRLLDWCKPRMKDDICKGTLANMRIDPTQIPPPEKKNVERKIEKKTPADKDCFSAVDQRDITPMADDLPEDIETYLLFTPENEMNWIGDNFERMTWLRNKGFFVLVGADNRVGLPPKLSPFGKAVIRLLKKRRL